jgi:hypothetical protein
MAPICTTDDAKFCTVNVEARWRSGDAEDCKSLHAGSIPARASRHSLKAHRVPPIKQLLKGVHHIVGLLQV